MPHPETVVVVAHPDDEVLWFASVLPRADNVILAFGPYGQVPHLGVARDEAVAELPFPTTFLRLEEAGSYATANWDSPVPTPNGIALDRAPPDVRGAYEANALALRERLRTLLRPDQSVFSHNPWGEYGHEDHILVFRAVEALRREIGFQHWIPAYVSSRSARVARDWMDKLGRPSAPAAIDRNFTAAIEAIYQNHLCWTWDSGWVWPEQEWFFEMYDHPQAGDGSGIPQLINVTRSHDGG